MPKKIKKAKDKKAPAKAGPTGAPAKGQPSISLCMMVKNEEERLSTALASAAPWVDEIIVVDTGSTDRSVEIAESYGAKVFHHPWEYNFSKHRNQSISYASGDWLLILDADEELDQETAPLIRELVKDPEVNCWLFELENQVAGGGTSFVLHARLFRNHVGFHYAGLVHNRPTVQGKVAASKVRLFHYGYAADPETMEAKNQRRLEMIGKWVEREPDNYLSHAYMAQTLLARSETLEQAMEEGLKALELAKRDNIEAIKYPFVYYPLLNALAQLEREEEVLRYCQECLERVPIYPDPVFFQVGIYYKQQRWEEVCQASQLFERLQADCRQNPQNFIHFENVSITQMSRVFFRWAVAAAHLERQDEARAAFQRILEEREAEFYAQHTLQLLVGGGFFALAQDLAGQALEHEPSWTWAQEILEACRLRAGQEQGGQLRAQGLAALEAGDQPAAEQLLRQAAQYTPQDPELLLALGRALDQPQTQAEAQTWLMRGLNLHFGHPWAWRRLAEMRLAEGDQRSAAALLGRYLSLNPQDHQAQQQYQQLAQDLAQAGPQPSVAQAPPRLLVLLVGGLTPEMVREPVPHIMMQRAWGQFMGQAQGPPGDLPAWATIYTGVDPEVHGMSVDPSKPGPAGFNDLKVLTVWEVMAQSRRVGLLSIPMGNPPSRLNGWALAGPSGQPLEPALAQPPEIACLALAAGYRPDFTASQFDELTSCQRLERDVRQQAGLYQVERNRLATAMALPAVEVLVIGLNTLERMQACFDLASYPVFAAYQQVYACIESLLAGLRPENFAIISQRGYARTGRQPATSGFYCLSWLKGEDGKARAQDIAPAMLQLLGLSPQGLGQPR